MGESMWVEISADITISKARNSVVKMKKRRKKYFGDECGGITPTGGVGRVALTDEGVGVFNLVLGLSLLICSPGYFSILRPETL